MTPLSLPEDAEPFIPEGGDISDLRSPGVYTIKLIRPDDVAARWDQHFHNRPPYWDEFVNAKRVLYVGASNDVLGRLEDHRDGEKRQAALLRECWHCGVSRSHGPVTLCRRCA